MKKQLVLIIVLCCPIFMIAQDLEIAGKAKIGTMDKVNTADSVVVRLADSTLAIRDVSTLTEMQILSISNDTIFLSDGGFVELPADMNAGWTMDADTTSTLKYVGIGTTSPLMKLHAKNNTSEVLLLENAQSLNVDVANELYFKTGDGPLPYTGAIKTIGTGTVEARLGLFTFAAGSPSGLRERLSILDGGNVGIGTDTPGAKLEVAGPVRVGGKITNVTDPSDSQDAATKAYVDSRDTSSTNELELPQSPSAGDMNYWNGTAWVVVATTVNEGAALQMISGVPTWVGGTPPPPSVTNPTTGEIWMDRNLGATQVATSSTDFNSYGDLYQWGRGSDGHQTIVWTSSTASDGAEQANETSTLSSMDQPGHGNFILVSSSPFDWRSPQNDNLWQGVNGTNNPCPAGYRIPTEAEWEAERMSWSSNDAAGAFASPLKLPLAGIRFLSDGSLFDVGSTGDYWSSTVSGTGSRGLYFGGGTASMGPSTRADGRSVRCLKD